MKDRIDKGDVVNIYFGEGIGHEFGVVVLYAPCATGDSWHVQRPDGTIVNVMFYQKMVRVYSAKTLEELRKMEKGE